MVVKYHVKWLIRLIAQDNFINIKSQHIRNTITIHNEDISVSCENTMKLPTM
jgi:hypothetical protein